MFKRSKLRLAISCLFVSALSLSCLSAESFGQSKELVEALKIRPQQKGVDYDTPKADEIKNCEIKELSNPPGWLIIDGSGRVLRKFLSVNGDKDLDHWGYYKNGIEVYRDIDADFDLRVENFRWMGSEGMRWGVDTTKNGKIDRWKMISAEEVTAEIFAAIRDRDPPRFGRVLLAPSELGALRLDEKLNKKVTAQVRAAASGFARFAQSQKAISAASRFEQFGTSVPQLVPQEKMRPVRTAQEYNSLMEAEQKSALVVHDHAFADFTNGSKYQQLAVGTLVQVGKHSWRVVDLPELVTASKPVGNGGIFFPLPDFGQGTMAANNPKIEKINKLMASYGKIEEDLAKASGEGAKVVAMEKERAKIMEQIISLSSPKEKSQWIRSLADAVANSYYEDRFPEGLGYLNQFAKTLNAKEQKTDVEYVQWRIINSRWTKSLDGDSLTRAKGDDRYYGDLAEYAKAFPQSEQTARAQYLIATRLENTDRTNPEKAIEIYKKLASQFPNQFEGKFAAGAIKRLGSIGKTVAFSGKTVDGQTFSLSNRALRGKIVVIHYWDTNCKLCIEGMEDIQRLNSKYGKEVVMVGANLDLEPSRVKAFLGKNKSITWPQLWAQGGEQSSLATQFGVAVSPTLIVIDQEGRLTDANLSVNELEREIQRLRKQNAKR